MKYKQFIGLRLPPWLRASALGAALLNGWLSTDIGPARAGLIFLMLLLGASPRPMAALLAVAPILVAFPPLGLARLLAPFAYTGFFLAAETEKSHGRAALLGLVTGLAHAWCLGSWSVQTLESPVLALAVLSVYLGLVWAAIGSLSRAALRGPRNSGLLLTPLIIPTLEWARCFNTLLPVPYSYCAHLASYNLCLAQWVEPLGVFGLGALLCGFSLGTSRLIRGWPVLSRPQRLKHTRLLAGLLMFLYLAGWLRTRSVESWPYSVRHAVIIQEYDPRDGTDRYTPERRQELKDRIRKFVKRDSLNYLFLPETVLKLPFSGNGGIIKDPDAPHPEEVRGILSEEGRRGLVVLAGTEVDTRLSSEEAWGYRNAACAIDAARGVFARRDKLIGAPVGEVAPFKGFPLLESILGQKLFEGDRTMVSSDARGRMELSNGDRFLVTFCFEHLLPGIWSLRKVRRPSDANLQVVFADLRWFLYSPIERAQSHAARALLAIRLRVPLLYAANGSSELVSSSGRMLTKARPTDKSVEWRLPLRKGPLDVPARWCQLMRPRVPLLLWLGALVFGGWALVPFHPPEVELPGVSDSSPSNTATRKT